MNRFLLLLLIAGLVFLVVLFAARPDLLENVWLWIIGLAGGIIKAFQSLFAYFKNNFGDEKDEEAKSDKKPVTESNAPATATGSPFNGITLKLLRFDDDGDTTTGLLFIDDAFFCYTLEEAANEPKIPGETRIPKGVYPVVFRKEETDFTAAYRTLFPEWFSYHLQLKDVPDFKAVYIHEGGDYTNTEGCILVTNSLITGSEAEALTAARGAFKKLYGFLNDKLDSKIPVRIVIKDELWIKQLN